MSQPCRLISWSMALHSSGPRELKSSPTAENRLLFTALATCRHITAVSMAAFHWVHLHLWPGSSTAHWPSWGWALGWTRGRAPHWSRNRAGKTRWAWWWGRKASSCNTCRSGGSRRPRCSSPAWWRRGETMWEKLLMIKHPHGAVLTVRGWWRWWTGEGTGPPGCAAPPPGRTAWTCVYRPLPFCRSSSRSCRDRKGRALKRVVIQTKWVCHSGDYHSDAPSGLKYTITSGTH